MIYEIQLILYHPLDSHNNARLAAAVRPVFYSGFHIIAKGRNELQEK